MPAEYPCAVPYDAETRREWINLRFPLPEYAGRLAKVRVELAAAGLDGLLVVGNSLDSASLAYLANYRPHFGQSVLLVPLDGKPVFVTNAILHGEPMHSSLWDVILDDLRPAAARTGQPPGTLVDLLVEALEEQRLDRGALGIASPDTMPLSVGLELRERLPDVDWRDGTMAVLRPRAIKSEREIAYLREACRITRAALAAGIAACEPGTSEREVASIIHATMMAEGAEGLGFETAVSSGPRAGLKHADPTDRRLEPGDMVFLDAGAVVGGYHADVSRTLTVGQPGTEEQALLDTAAEMFRECLRVIKPGAPVRDIYRAAERIARRAGFSADYMPNGLGHGVGLAIFELPFLGPDDDTLLEPGMVFALEPMLVRYGLGTAVIEETVLVTEDGCEVLGE